MPIAAQAHTDSLGYIITAGDAAGSYDVEIVYGSYHCSNPSLCLNNTGGTPVAAEGSVDLKMSDGTEVGTQPFSILLADVADGTLPAGLVPGDNYFYADGSSLSGTRPAGFEGTYTFQSATFLNLAPGTYTFGYASNALSQNWLPLNDAINAGTFTISADGSISVPGVGSDMQSGGTYASSGLGSSVNPVFKGGTLTIDENGETYAQNFTLDNSGTNTIDMAGNGTTLSGSFSDEDPTQPGAITFDDSVGGGQVTLTGINTQTGGTTLNAGTLALAGEGTLGADTNKTTVNGGTLDLGGTAQVQAALNQNGGMIEDGSIAVGTYTLTDGQVASNATINASSGFDVYNGQIDGTLSGTGALDKLGTGTVVLTGTNDYTGGTTISGGILQLGNGGTTGSIIGNIADNGTLVVDRSNAVALDGAISGSGRLVQAGSGTTTLSGPNSYGGGTYVQDGTLALAGEGTLGAATGSTFVSGGTLDLGGTTQQQASLVQTGGLVDNGRADVGTYHLFGGELGASATVDASDAFDVRSGLVSGTLTGTGALIKGSGGTVILAGDNDYSGGTTIERGTLVVGNGGTTGSITGDVTDNGSLIFDRSDEVTFGGAVSGSGSLTQAGGGTLVLTGDSDYRGGTTISGGVLQLGNGGTTGSIAGNITDNSVLVVDRSNAVTLDGTISGTGSVVQAGTGVTTLSGADNYTGGTYVEDGTLTLQGDGMLGATTGSTFVTGGTLDLGGTTQQQASLVQAGGLVDNGRANVGTYQLFGGELGAGATVDASDAFDVRNGLISGTLVGTGALTKSSSGTVILAGDNSYTGGTTIERGTLVLGNGGTTGSITGDVTNNGVLVVDHSNAITLDGAISGTGALVQAGTGTTTLSGPNSYEGGTYIQDGTLALAGEGTLGAATGSTFVIGGNLDLGGTTQQQASLVQAGGLVDNGRANVGTYHLLGGELGAGASVDASDAFDVRYGLVSGTLTGTGALTKTSPGTVILAGDNDYSGGTTIEGGALVLGNGGTTGSITGDVTNDSVLAFNRSDDTTFGGAISGSGVVAQIGTGSTRLADGNSYTGGTFIANGTLIGSASSFGSGPVLDNAALVIDQTEDADFSNALGGTGSLTKTGTGTLNLVTDSGLSGPTTLAQGGLAVNASFADSAFTAESGTTLSGTGILGGLTVRNGATLATGNNGIGTLGVAGNILQENGSNWQVQLASTGETDRVITSGNVQIGDGAILTVTKIDGQRYALDARYTVLDAEGGVTGRYTLAGDTRISAFFDLVGNYGDPNEVVLEAEQTRRFNELDGLSRNEGASAAGAQSLGLGNSLFNAIAYLDSESEARNAFDQISGEAYSSVKSDAIEDSRFLREAVDLRLRSSTGGIVGQTVDEQTGADSPARETGISVWGHGFGAWGHLGGDGNAAQLHRSIGGFFVGADAAVAENWRVGVLGGYSHSEFHATGRSSNGNSDNYHVGIYGGGNVGPIGVRAGAAYTWQKLDVDRSIGFTGFSDALSANTREQTAQLFGEAGYRIDVNGGSWEPFAQLAYVHLHSKGFTETGGAAALGGDGDNTNVTFSTVGLRASKTLTAAGTASLYGSLGWRHAFGDRTPLTTLRFASGSDAFTVAGTPIAEDAAALEAGVDTKLGKGLSLGVAYSGQLSSHMNDHGVKAMIGWKF